MAILQYKINLHFTIGQLLSSLYLNYNNMGNHIYIYNQKYRVVIRIFSGLSTTPFNRYFKKYILFYNTIYMIYVQKN